MLVAPWEVAAAVALAAAMHECGHLAALRLLGAPAEGMSLGALGAEIYAPLTRRLSYAQEAAATLAGPAVNLIAAPLIARLASIWGWEWGWLFAGAHAVLGVYNLLPVPPLDGSRALYLLAAYRLGPDAGDRVRDTSGLLCSLALTALGAYLALRFGGALFLISALGLLFPQLGLAKKRTGV